MATFVAVQNEEPFWSLIFGPPCQPAKPKPQVAPRDIGFWDLIFGSPRPLLPPADPNLLFSKHERAAADAARLLVAHFSRSGALAYREDCIAEAKKGLWQACLRYDPNKNDNFWGYAKRRVRGAVYDYMRTERIIVKSGLPDHTALMFISGDEVPEREEADCPLTLFETIPDTREEYSSIEQTMDSEKIFCRAHLSTTEEKSIEQNMEGTPNTKISKMMGCSITVVSDNLNSAKNKLLEAWMSVGGMPSPIKGKEDTSCTELQLPLPTTLRSTIFSAC
jgi:RNA polymerase sigma factor (sigma-70 family)